METTVAASTESSPEAIVPAGQLVAFLDIGTNSVRMMLVRFSASHGFTVVADEKETVRLGEGEFQQSLLQPDAIRRAVQVCARFAEMARSRGASQIQAVATSATREAANRRVFLRRLKRVADVDVRVISGKEEARLIYLGVSRGINLGSRRALFIDIGGGSTEIINGDQQQHFFLDSLRMGSIRLAAMFDRPEQAGPVSPRQFERMQRFVRLGTVRTVQQLKTLPCEMVIGSSGTILNLADVAVRLAHKRPLVKGDTVTRGELRDAVKLLCSLPLAERRKAPGLNPDRADIIIAGAAILQTLMDELDLPDIAVSDRSLRDGLPIDFLSRSEGPHLLQHGSFRERTVLELGRRCGFDEPHARHVVKLAWQLFDSAREIELHAFGEWERELLEHAALLHDVGAFVSYTNHRLHSGYLIRNADLLGFDQTEISIIAAVVMFHHKAFPGRKHAEFAELDKRPRQVVRCLCVLLRLAESLDRGHLGAITDARLVAEDRRQVVLQITAARDCQLEISDARHHEKAFRSVFKRDLTVAVRPAT